MPNLRSFVTRCLFRPSLNHLKFHTDDILEKLESLQNSELTLKVERLARLFLIELYIWFGHGLFGGWGARMEVGLSG